MAWDGTTEQRKDPLTEEQLALISAETEHAVHSGLKRWSRRAAGAYVLLLVALVFIGRGYIERLHDGLAGSCHRVNVLRAQSNASDYVSFKILSLSGQREAALAKTSKSPAVAHVHNKSAQGLWDQARNLTVTQMTDCEQAIEHPDSYKTPVAGPIGSPESGTTYPSVQKVLDQSRQYLRVHG